MGVAELNSLYWLELASYTELEVSKTVEWLTKFLDMSIDAPS